MEEIIIGFLQMKTCELWNVWREDKFTMNCSESR